MVMEISNFVSTAELIIEGIEVSKSVNERKTENIVRKHFQVFSDIKIEEQSSDDPRINKLLNTASKKGLGKGKPEFIITYNSNANLLLVIEYKADLQKHESPNKDKYSNYAVDGVLLYSSYLAKDFDVIAIAISGENKNELKISHFLQLQGEKKAVNIFGDKLLSTYDYLDGYLKSPEKYNQDYNKLLAFTKKLNDSLHSHKILESQRSLLISCILIALESDAFKMAYKLYGDTKLTDTSEDKKEKIENAPKALANYLVDTVVNELDNANIKDEKLANLKIQFSFIRTDTSLSTTKDMLKNLIADIDENINSFIKTYKFFDVLGQLYVEFLSYANSDKGLGIVLTPPHITELFSDLAQVNKNSLVYDNCVGTCGFLISAMKKMIKDANGDNKKISEIKKNKLIGVEYQAHIFALAISNMYIHQDGKTNIINGSCFDIKVIKKIKKKKPTIGFLNPPYKADKKNDTEELEFVLNNLNCLIEGGTCVSIVPMQSALAQSGRIYELKKRLLKYHTLEAVLSMPDELFYNSNVNVVSCIMIFTAHKPHPTNKETFFGYFKNDGFEKRKNRGRVDAYLQWQKIKEQWLSCYFNKKSIPGLSVAKIVSAKDEWCAEEYMQTDYSNLLSDLFEKEIRKYVAYQIINYKSLHIITSKNIIKNDFDLKISDWCWFQYSDLFNIERGKGARKNNLIENGETPLITSIDLNNGLIGFVDIEPYHIGNVITVNRNGSVGNAYYQKHPFCSTEDVHVFNPLFNLNKYIAMFLITLIQKEKYRYNYGRKWGLSRMNCSKIKLPVDEQGEPDWNFMENYIKSLPYSKSL